MKRIAYDTYLYCKSGCGQELDPFWRYCPACGQSFSGRAVNESKSRVGRKKIKKSAQNYQQRNEQDRELELKQKYFSI